jgi:ATP-dependent RNA helicase RhlE
VDFFVLDEADTILDMGFVSEVSQIITLLKVKRQNILLSATLSSRLRELSGELLTKPITIDLALASKIPHSIKQVCHPVESSKKLELLSYIIGSRNYKHVLVFVRKRELADEVSRELLISGLSSESIHGGKSPGARARVLSAFRAKRVRVLVATDIAARGLDIKELDTVISYDIPHIAQDFIHRIGRVGRAGREGLAITLISPQELIALKGVEQILGKKIVKKDISGYSPLLEIEDRQSSKKSNKKESKTEGAFGKKKSYTTSKKRKTTKRDGYKKSTSSKNRSNSRDKKRK